MGVEGAVGQAAARLVVAKHGVEYLHYRHVLVRGAVGAVVEVGEPGFDAKLVACHAAVSAHGHGSGDVAVKGAKFGAAVGGE